MTGRIPTIFGLSLLMIALILGASIYYYQQILSEQKMVLLTPKKIELTNITDSSVTITWQTDIPSRGNVIFTKDSSKSQNQLDYRDKKKRQNWITHYVTLQNLDSDSKYLYKIQVGDYTYPDSPLEFRTAQISGDKFFDSQPLLNQPVRGTVVDSNFKPVDEAIVFLKISGASKLSTFVSTAGNFIIPLTDLRTEDLKNLFILKESTDATLEILRGNTQSLVDITLPLNSQSLSALQLGRNINLKEYLAISSNQVNKDSKIKFDLNSDNKVNSVDLSILLDNFGKNPKVKAADFNSDGVVDQKDIDLLQKAL